MPYLEKTENAIRNREDRELLRRYHATGDPRVREKLVERFMPLARRLARRYNRGSESLDDLTQVAAIGLLKAIDRFDPERRIAFSSYAVPTIAGELKRHFRDHTWSVRPPRDLLERTLRVEAISEEFATDHGRAPTVPEIAVRLEGCNDEDVLEALHARRAAKAASLDAPVSADGEDEHTLADRIGGEDGGYALAEDRAMLDTLLRAVTPRERMILHMRFVDDMTQAEIGEVIGVSQMQISRLVRQSVDRMRTSAESRPVVLAG